MVIGLVNGLDKVRVRNRIRELRFAHGEMTQQGLATAVGCSRQTIVLLEQGRYSPSLTREDGLMMQIEAQRPHVAPF